MRMIELVDTFPDVNVQPAEYKRLLGYPADHVLDGRAPRADRLGPVVVHPARPALGLCAPC